MAYDEVRSQIAQLLVRRCNNCYRELPGPIGGSVHAPGWNWVTPNFGPFCDDCVKEVSTIRVFSVTRVVSQAQEKKANFDLPLRTFADAYDELRRACPNGDIRIHLTVTGEKAPTCSAHGDPLVCLACEHEEDDRPEWRHESST